MYQPWSAFRRLFRTGSKPLAIAALIGLAVAGPLPAAPPLPIEDSDTAVLLPPNPHRYFMFNAFGSGLTTVIDGDDTQLKTIGSIPGPGNGMIGLSRTGDKFYIAETYWSRGNRGDRTDQLSIYDGRTLQLEREIRLPGRLIVNPKTPQLATSDDGRLGYVYDLMPASAVHVVDLAEGKFLTSIDIPGCALVHAYGKRSFATICGDGTLGTVNLPASGTAKASFTRPFFKPDVDPVFDNSVIDRTSGEGWLMTYSGQIIPVQLGTTVTIGKPWSITAAAGMPVSGTGVQELAWRPGGQQVLAVHRATRRLYILMHAGNYWTQKLDGTEVWVLDSVRRTLIKRIKLEAPGHGIAVTQDDKPLLFVIGSAWAGTIDVYDAVGGDKLRGRKLRGIIGLAPGL